MPRQNRVTPFGEIVAEPWRGQLMGNRGCLHDETGHLGTRRWRHPHWVCCLLEFRGCQRPVMPPGRWTALFFWDEAAALAAGHRPCGFCRRGDYRRFMAGWQAAGLPGRGPTEVDRILHCARVHRDRRQRRFEADSAGLPDGCFVLLPGGVALVQAGKARPLDPLGGGYGSSVSLPPLVTVLSPAPIVEVLRAGYRPMLRLGPQSQMSEVTSPPG